MEIRPIKKVTVEFADGEVRTWELPNVSQGFYRERYTFKVREQGEAGFDKWGQRLNIYELFWSLTANQEGEQEEEGTLTLEQHESNLATSTASSSKQDTTGNGKK